MMDSTYQDLAERALQLLQKSGKYRIVILLIGAPGSGKTTIANRVVDLINKKFREEGRVVDNDCCESVLEGFNDSLPKYNAEDVIDYENEEYIPTIEKINNTDIIRGRGEDLTSIKITNEFESDNDQLAQVIPMDGFHLPRVILKKFKDSEKAFDKRGSTFTFDSTLIVKLVENLNETIQVSNDHHINSLEILKNSKIPNIYIPNFDHSSHDPSKFGCKINSNSRILIMEGLYLLLNNPIWDRIPKNFKPNIEMDLKNKNFHNYEDLIFNNIKEISVPKDKNFEFWKILINEKKILTRVSKRHLNAGIVNNLKKGEERVKLNDLPNGEKIYKESFKSDLNIISIDDSNESI